MSVRELNRALAAIKDAPPLCAVVSQDPFFIRRIYSHARKVLGDPERDTFSAQRIDLSELDPSEAAASIQSPMLLASQRVIYLFGLDKVSASALSEMEKVLFPPPVGTSVIAFLEKVDKRKKFFTRLLKESLVFKFDSPQRGELGDWVRFFASERNVKVDRAALVHLQESLPLDLMQVESEVEKLCLALGEKKREIDSRLVQHMVSGSFVENIFEVGDKLGSRDVRGALKILSILLDRGEEGIVLNGLLARHFRALRLARAVSSPGKAKEELKKVFGIHPYFADKYIRQARVFSRDQLDRAIEIFYSNDRRLKTGDTARHVLEETVIRVCS